MTTKISSETVEKYTYKSESEREEHVRFMEMHGWNSSGKKKQFIGSLMIDDVNDPKNYVWYAEFYRNNLL